MINIDRARARILAIQTGPELDAEIAQVLWGVTVLGIVPCHPWPDSDDWYPCHCIGEICPMGPGLPMPVFAASYHCSGTHDDDLDDLNDPEPMVLGHRWSCLTVVRNYCEDMGWAWTGVVERMRAWGWVFSLTDNVAAVFSLADNVAAENGTMWEANFCLPWWSTERVDKMGFTDVDQTVEVAICRAALIAIAAVPINALLKDDEEEAP